jgi:hypothetical protein
MVRAGRFEKFLEMFFRLSCLVLEIMLYGLDILLVGAARFLLIIVVTGGDYDPSGVPLLPLLAALSAFFGAFANDFEWRCPTTAKSHFPITQNKDDPNRLLTRGVPGGDIKQLLGGVRLITAECMHQGPISCAGPEIHDDVSVAYFWEFTTILGEALNVILEGFT